MSPKFRQILRTSIRIAWIVLWICMLSGFVWTWVQADHAEEQQLLKQTDIQILPDSIHFLSKSDIENIVRLNRLPKHPTMGDVYQLSISAMERRLQENKYVLQARVYGGLDGILHIDVQQRRPIVRIFRPDGLSYLVDENACKMPITERFNPRVVLASGMISEGFRGKTDSLYSIVARNLLQIASFVDKHEFWKAQIEQIFVTDSSEFILVPKVGNHTIELGDANDLENKFRNLFVFYKDVMNYQGWNTYKSINLKYKNQIICRK